MAFNTWWNNDELPEDKMKLADWAAIEQLNKYKFMKWLARPTESEKQEKDYCFADTCLTNYNGTLIVIKFINDEAEFDKELKILTLLNGEHHTIPLVGSFKISPVGCHALLFNYYNFNIQSKVTLHKKPRQDYMWFLLQAINYIHNKKIVHRDIKPDNIGVDYHKGELTNLFLSDFGFACFEDEEEMKKSMVGTIAYMGTEMLHMVPRSTLTNKVDIFSAGILFAEMIRNKAELVENSAIDARKSYDKLANNVIAWLAERGIKPREKEGKLDQEFDLLCGLLEPDPSSRLTAAQALQHPYFSAREK